MPNNSLFGIKPLYADWNCTDPYCTERIGFRPDILYNFPVGSQFLLYLNSKDREVMGPYGKNGRNKIIGIAECIDGWDEIGKFPKRNENHTMSLPVKITLLLKDSRNGIPLYKFKKHCKFNPLEKKHRHYCPISSYEFKEIKKLFMEKSYWEEGEVPPDFYPSY